MLREYVDHNPLAGTPINDAESYWQWAGQIAHGQLLQDTPFFSAPLYPYLLGALRALGGSLTVVYGVQVVADLATAALLACTARRRFGAAVGLVAGGLYLLMQEPASATLRILPSSLQLLLVSGTWASLVRVQAAPSAGNRIILGILLGLLCLADATALLLVMAAGPWLFHSSTRRVADAAWAALPVAVAAVIIAPATWHNWRACGEWFLIRSGSGITLRQGNQPESIGAYTTIAGISTRREQMHLDAARLYRERFGVEPTWKELDRYYRNEVLHDWRVAPLRACRLAARKVYWFVASHNYADIYQPQAEIAAGLSRRLALAPLVVPWLMGPALVGLVLLLRHPVRHAPEWLLFAVPLAVVVVFFYSPRYRIPALPIVAVTAAWAVVRAGPWRTHPRTGAFVAGGLLVGVLLGPLNRAIGFDRYDPAALSLHVAYALKAQGRLRDAVEWQRAGVQQKPQDATGHLVLGNSLTDLGRTEEALAEYQQACALRPDDAETLRQTAQALSKLGRIAEAEQVLTRAVELRPGDAFLLSRLAAAKQVRGEAQQAQRLYEQALAIRPKDPEIRMLYGDLLVQLRDWAAARALFGELAQVESRAAEAHYYLGVIAGETGDWGEARRNFERSLEVNPRVVRTLHALGVLDFKEQRFAEAADCFRRALTVDPNDRICRAALQEAERAQSAGADPKR